MKMDLDAVPVPDAEIDRLLMDMRLRRFAPFLSGRVLDVGCGAGLMMEKIRALGFTVDGVDGSPERVEACRSLNPDAEVSVSLFQDFRPTAKYDTCVVSNVLEHLPESLNLLRLCYRWLKTGGRVLVSVPNREALHKRIGRAMGFKDDLTESDRRVGHVRVFTLESLTRDVVSAGFDVTARGGVCVKPLPNSRMVELDGWESLLEGYFRASWDPSLHRLCSVVFAVGVKG